MTLNFTQGHRKYVQYFQNCGDQDNLWSLILSPLSRPHHYVTACDLEKSFGVDTAFNIIARYAFWCLCKHV